MDVKTRNKLREIFNKHDSIDIYFGRDFNFDEYDPEIDMAFVAFKKSKCLKEFADRLYAIFKKMFNNDAGHKSIYAPFSKGVYSFLKNN